MTAVLLIAASYLLGAIPAGLLLARAARGVDVRQVGSGNIGTANVMRAAGVGVGLAVLSCDVLKGAAPVLASRALGLPLWTAAVAGLAAVAGHNWSVFLRGRGGKGVATSFGVILAFAPKVALVLLVTWVGLVALTRYSSVGSIAGLALAPALMALTRQPREAVAFAAVAAVLGIYKHRANLARLLAGTEHRITDRLRRGTPAGS